MTVALYDVTRDIPKKENSNNWALEFNTLWGCGVATGEKTDIIKELWLPWAFRSQNVLTVYVTYVDSDLYIVGCEALGTINPCRFPVLT